MKLKTRKKGKKNDPLVGNIGLPSGRQHVDLLKRDDGKQWNRRKKQCYNYEMKPKCQVTNAPI